VSKAELAADKRFESVNEFRQTLTDQQQTFMPRLEAAERMNSMTDKLAMMKEQFDDSSEAVRLRAAAAYLRLVWLKKPLPRAQRTFAARKAAPPADSSKKQ
jgi:hypothetical protein